MERTIERSIGNAIRVLSNMIHREITNSPGMKLVERVTGTNAWIIGYIAQQGENDVFQRDLEQKFGITRSTASKVVNLMVQKGLIVREKVPGDARLKKLMLTNRSREMLDMMVRNSRAWRIPWQMGLPRRSWISFSVISIECRTI